MCLRLFNAKIIIISPIVLTIEVNAMNFRQFLTNNRWWGKLIGAFLGYLIGGPAGAFFGLLIGNFFDRALIEHFNNPYWNYYAEKKEAIQKIFFEATFVVMGYIAKADGRVSEKEISIAKSLMNEMRLDREQKTLAKQFFNAGKSANFNLNPILNSLRQNCQNNPELLKLFLDIQYRAALTGELSSSKFAALDNIFRELGFIPLHRQYRFYEDFGYTSRDSSSYTNTNYSDNKRQQSNYRQSYQAPNPLSQAYAILEIKENASKQEVKRAYRRLISRNHPDKLIAQGLPEEMIKIANDKTQKITKAYEQICSSKGW